LVAVRADGDEKAEVAALIAAKKITTCAVGGEAVFTLARLNAR
jgi:hypothetical protein